MRKQILLFFFTTVVGISSLLSQAIDPDDSFTIELGLPNSFVNKPFMSIMQGLVAVSPLYQYTLKNHLSFGLGLHYTYFAIDRYTRRYTVTSDQSCKQFTIIKYDSRGRDCKIAYTTTLES